MRLHRLTLRDVKGVRERSVDFPDHGVVVVEGPNEVGKTTMIEAFDALLSFKASSRAAGVRALQPVDRDVGPFVEAELTIGGTRVRFAKRWLRQPATTLSVLGPRPEQLTGDVAQQRVDTLVRAHLDRTLWDALRLTQSGDGTVASLTTSTVLTEALDAAAGAHQHADGADALLQSVQAEYSTYFTPTGRPTGDYRAALAGHTEAQDAVAEAHRRVQEGAGLLARLAAARQRREEAEGALAVAAHQLGEAEEAGARAERVAAARAEAQERHEHARQLHVAAVAASTQRRRQVQECEALVAEVAAVEKDRDLAAEEAEALSTAYLRARERAEEAARVTEGTEALVESCRSRSQLLADADELARREELLDRVTRLVEEIAQARADVPSPAVEREAARRARSLHDTLSELLRQHDAESPVLHVEAGESGVAVQRAGGSERQWVRSSDEARVVLTHDTVVDLPDRTRLRIQLQDDSHARMARIVQLQEQLFDVLRESGATDVEELERSAEATEDARRSVLELTRDLQGALAGRGDDLAAQALGAGLVPGVLVEEVSEARRLLEEGLAALADGSDLPADGRAARAAVNEAVSRHRRAREEQGAAQVALDQARTAVARLTQRLDRAQGRIQVLAERVDDLRTRLERERAEQPDEDLAALVRQQAERVEAESARLRRAEEAMAVADVDGARARLASAREQHRRAVADREAALHELHTLAGQVEMTAGEGREELYDLAVAELQEAERLLVAVDRRARAARHLHSTLTRHRDAAHRTYVRPYTEALEELGRQVYGPGFGVTVDDQLGLASRTLDGATVGFAELSGGAKEQLGILARLAVARLVDPVQGVPVVIDDALGYSDPRRLRQMGEVLGAAGVTDGLQVILLTCTPERYSSIPEARTIRLTA
ncbi:AAA family ATPase [Ornithinimicrobium flavum]|uniref:AAA family ATPase n=1 Tax=Ornithinimicrobium flavum TaxID=1288636 RepID=UPI00107028A2|nr:AAA family ATPase [Ornithinimicrobium flavum]